MIDLFHQLLIPFATASVTLGLFHLIAEVHIRLFEGETEDAGLTPAGDVWE